MAIKKYTDYNGEGLESIEKAIKIVKDQLEVIDNIIYKKFDSSKYFEGEPKEKLETLKNAAEFLQKQTTKKDNVEQRFMKATYKMKRAFNLCSGIKDFTYNKLDKINYYCAIRSYIFQLKKGDAPDIVTMNKKV